VADSPKLLLLELCRGQFFSSWTSCVRTEEAMEMGFSVTRRKVGGGSGGPRGKASDRSDGVL